MSGGKEHESEHKSEHHTHSGHAKESNEKLDVTFDFDAAKIFLRKYGWILLILIPMFLAFYFRAIPIGLPITDQFAENTINQNIRNQISSQIAQQYPQLSGAQLNSLIDKGVQDFWEANRGELEKQKEQLSNQFKELFRDDDGQTYFGDLDTYHYLRFTRNIIENGHAGDEIRDGISYDTHMIAPIGRTSRQNFHNYAQLALYYTARIFKSDTSLITAVYFLNAVFAALSVIPAFFIGRRIKGNFTGFFAASLLAVHTAFLTRTSAGFADTDVYNVFFPVWILWFIIESFAAKTQRNKYILMGIAGMATGLYSWAWAGWWHIFLFILGAFGVLALIELYKAKDLFRKPKEFLKKHSLNEIILLGVGYFFFTGLGVLIFKGSLRTFFLAFTNPFQFLFLKAAAQESLWPNVYTTVAELNKPSLNGIIQSIGGGSYAPGIIVFGILAIVAYFFMRQNKNMFTQALLGISALLAVFTFNTRVNVLFILAIVGLVMLLWKGLKDKNLFYPTLLILWFLATLYASTKGIRFTMLAVPPFVFGLSYVVGVAHEKGSEWLSKEFKRIASIISPIIAVILLGVLFFPVNFVGTANAIAQQHVPSMNDAWWGTLTNIKDNSQENAIITSWWDFGHWFKFIADRPVTFDGASQNNPQAHWVGKILLTSNEKQAIGILRMLDCGATTAFDELDKENNDITVSVDMLYDIVELKKEAARKYLINNGISSDTANAVIERTHCEPPEAFFIASSDMVSKAGVWAHFGSWNFSRARYWTTLRGESEASALNQLSGFGIEGNEATNIFFEVNSLAGEDAANTWIAPWPSYQSQRHGCNVDDNTATCGNGLVVDLTTFEATISTQQGPSQVQRLAVFDGKENPTYYDGPKGSQRITASLYIEGDSYRSTLSQPSLEGSMFTRMFFDNGRGLRYFEPFDKRVQPGGGDIFVYKVKWPES